MKKITLLFIGFFIALIAGAQVSYSCHYREYCDWDEVSQQFINCSGYEDPSLFVMNTGETMFTHTTESLKSTYYVQTKEYNLDCECYTYDVVSDVGNKYYYIFDIANKEIRALYTDTDGKSTLVRFYIKASF